MKRAIRARKIIPLAGETAARTRQQLDTPLAALDNHVLVIDNNSITAVEPYAAFSRRLSSEYPLTDMGEVTLTPGLVNAHCHLELAHLGGKVDSGLGFVPWLQSLVSQIATPVEDADILSALANAMTTFTQSGTAHIGDVGSRNPALVAEALSFTPEQARPNITHFLEVLGYLPPQPQPSATESSTTTSSGSVNAATLPPQLAAEGYCPNAACELPEERFAHSALSGHALYSTSPAALQAAHRWCQNSKRPYSIHLAEPIEETECMLSGSGALYDFFSQRILPQGWKAPGLPPVAYAAHLGLLGERTLAVHCVQCDSADIALLAKTKTNVCLCPRSNAFINVGTAPATRMADAGILLCLGTDSHASNHDVDVRNEIRAAQDTWGFSPQAALRMATVNSAHALGLGTLGTLAQGSAAIFSVLWDE